VVTFQPLDQRKCIRYGRAVRGVIENAPCVGTSLPGPAHAQRDIFDKRIVIGSARSCVIVRGIFTLKRKPGGTLSAQRRYVFSWCDRWKLELISTHEKTLAYRSR
jgi:hypothetical protein